LNALANRLEHALLISLNARASFRTCPFCSCWEDPTGPPAKLWSWAIVPHRWSMLPFLQSVQSAVRIGPTPGVGRLACRLSELPEPPHPARSGMQQISASALRAFRVV
jgi:hypothetical protein